MSISSMEDGKSLHPLHPLKLFFLESFFLHVPLLQTDTLRQLKNFCINTAIIYWQVYTLGS